jgi:hypothetical protein
LFPFLFFNKSMTVTMVVPLFEVDLGIGSLCSAASFLGVPQQGSCDGRSCLASASTGRRAALLSHAMAFLQPPAWRPLLEIRSGVQHLLVPKWCVPGDVAVAGGGVPFPVERTKELIAFQVLVVGSFLQYSWTMLYFLISFRVLYVICIPPML